jgi:hypothetical protein
MMPIFRPLLVTVLLVAVSSDRLSSQVLPGNDFGTFSLHAGVLAPLTTFEDPSFGESKLESGFALGASITTWPTRGRWGFRAQLIRSRTDGTNAQYEFAPLAVNDPTQWIVTGEFALRQPMDLGALAGFPYVSAGVGAKQYNWTDAVHQEDRFLAWTFALGAELRHSALGPFALSLEARNYFSKFKAFGIEDADSWEPGFYGGNIDGVNNHDLLFTTALGWVF